MYKNNTAESANASETTSRRQPRQKPTTPKAIMAIAKNCGAFSCQTIRSFLPLEHQSQHGISVYITMESVVDSLSSTSCFLFNHTTGHLRKPEYNDVEFAQLYNPKRKK